jgi:F-type H+-transporting ATPase subunit gamma
MATKRELETRTRSIEKTKQIVRTMELVARNRLTGVKTRALAGRPYSEKINEVLRSVQARLREVKHPLLEKSEDINDFCLVLLSSDRGLCGGFNNNLFENAQRFIGSKKEKKVKLIVVGRKGINYFRRRNFSLINTYEGLENNKELKISTEIENRIIELYKNKKISEVYLMFNKFKQQLIGKVVIKRLLPFEAPEESKEKKKNPTEHLYEPSYRGVLDELIPQYIRNEIYQGALESRAQEEMARMLAMKQAADSADEMLDELKLQYHKLRQAIITREIIEVLGGGQTQ